jgi:hypothetical protein
MADNRTSIIYCKRCGFYTRHERQQWQRPNWLFLVTGRRFRTVEGWVCTKCGRRRVIRTI